MLKILSWQPTGSGIWKCVIKHSNFVSSVSQWPSQQGMKDDLKRGLAYQY